MAFMISVVHNFVNNDCTTPKKQKLRNEINWIELKLNEFSTARKNKPLSLPLKKKPVVKIWSEKWFEKKIIIIQQSSPFLIPQKKWIIMKKKYE